MTFGEIVRERREQLGMTQEELAEKMGYKSRSSINKIECGRNVTQKIIARLAEVLSTTPAHLMGWDQDAITAAESVQEDALFVTNSLESENIDLYNELLDLALTRNELLDVLRYANYVKSLRK